MEREFVSHLLEGFHPKSKAVLDFLTKRQYGELNALYPKLGVIFIMFRVQVAKRREKALAQKRENKKKGRMSAPRECFSGPPRSPSQPAPTPQREMATSDGGEPPPKDSIHLIPKGQTPAVVLPTSGRQPLIAHIKRKMSLFLLKTLLLQFGLQSTSRKITARPHLGTQGPEGSKSQKVGHGTPPKIPRLGNLSSQACQRMGTLDVIYPIPAVHVGMALGDVLPQGDRAQFLHQEVSHTVSASAPHPPPHGKEERPQKIAFKRES